MNKWILICFYVFYINLLSLSEASIRSEHVNASPAAIQRSANVVHLNSIANIVIKNRKCSIYDDQCDRCIQKQGCIYCKNDDSCVHFSVLENSDDDSCQPSTECTFWNGQMIALAIILAVVIFNFIFALIQCIRTRRRRHALREESTINRIEAVVTAQRGLGSRRPQ